MAYVERDLATNAVKGVYRRPQPGRATEELPDDHAEVLAFLKNMEDAVAAVQAQPTPLERVLLQKGVVTAQELAAERAKVTP